MNKLCIWPSGLGCNARRKVRQNLASQMGMLFVVKLFIQVAGLFDPQTQSIPGTPQCTRLLNALQGDQGHFSNQLT